MSFSCRLLDRSSGQRALTPAAPGTALGPYRQGSDSSTPPYPSRLVIGYDGGQHHLLPLPTPVPLYGPVSRLEPSITLPLPPAGLMARGRGFSGLSCIAQAGVRRLSPFHDVAIAYLCQTTLPTPIVVPYEPWARIGAGNEIRTRGLNLGMVALYRLSYTRVKEWPTHAPADRIPSAAHPCAYSLLGSPNCRRDQRSGRRLRRFHRRTHPPPLLSQWHFSIPNC